MNPMNKGQFPLLKLTALSLALAASVGCTAVPAATTDVQSQAVYPVDGVYQGADLDRMLAPVALYPDSLLSHVLIAATYPLEVVQAERWARRNDHLRPEQALEQADAYDWDPSVKALVATPDILTRMSEDLEWTQAVGEAFLAQQEDVLASIQLLRDRAYRAGNLRSDDHVAVARESDTIRIETVRREIVYVPMYDTRRVYGAWWHRSPPVYWDGFGVSVSFGHGIRWTLSYNVPTWYYFSDFYWRDRYVVIHHHHYHDRKGHPRRNYDRPRPYDGERWRHNPHHRRNVDYRHRDLVAQPPGLAKKKHEERVVGAPVHQERRLNDVEVRRRMLEVETQPRVIRRSTPDPIERQTPRFERQTPAPVVREQPRNERKSADPVVRQTPRFERPTPAPVVRQPPRHERKVAEPVVRQQPRIERPAPAPVVRQQPRVERSQPTPVVRQQPVRGPKHDERGKPERKESRTVRREID